LKEREIVKSLTLRSPVRLVVVAAVAGLVVSASGCGSENEGLDDTPTTGVQPAFGENSSTVPPSSADTAEDEASNFAAPPWLGKRVQLSFTSDEGWTYSDAVALDAPAVRFDKDVKTSPPGTARLVTTIGDLQLNIQDSTFVEPVWHAFTATNQGRTGPPAAVTEPPQLVFGSPDGVWFDPGGSLQTDACDLNMSESYLRCPVNQNVRPGTTSSDSVPEKAVDSFIANAAKTPPGFELTLFIPNKDPYTAGQEFKLLFDSAGNLVDGGKSGVEANLVE